MSNLEKKLILQAGRLSVLQADLTKSIIKLLEKRSNSSFHSAVLRNTLDQLVISPTYAITPASLTSPIAVRRAQITKFPTTQLHIAGQRAVIGMGSGILAGASISWVGWLGWLVGNADGLVGVIGLDASAAMGIGVLVGLAGIRWGVGKWERAKRRWMADWSRVGAGLGRDLESALNRVMREQVFLLAETGCEQLRSTATQRQQEVTAIKEAVETLAGTLEIKEAADNSSNLN